MTDHISAHLPERSRFFLVHMLQSAATHWATTLNTVPLPDELRALLIVAANQPGKLLQTHFTGDDTLPQDCLSLWLMHVLLAYAATTPQLPESPVTHELITRVAVAVESLGIALDLIDDVQDDDSTLIRAWGLPTALAVILAFQQLNHTALAQLPALAAIQAEAVTRANGGQFDDIRLAGQHDLPLDAAIDITARKSGSLVGMLYRMGVCLGSDARPGEEHQTLDLAFERFGTALGIIFQLENDQRDANNPEKRDRALDKPTLPLLLEHRYHGAPETLQAYVDMTCRVTIGVYRQRALNVLAEIAVSGDLDVSWLNWLL